jgi:hypothetical protein
VARKRAQLAMRAGHRTTQDSEVRSAKVELTAGGIDLSVEIEGTVEAQCKSSGSEFTSRILEGLLWCWGLVEAQEGLVG